jgi:hypothetical protein
VAFPFDSSSSCYAALGQLSRILDTEAACGYVTLVNLARKKREVKKEPAGLLHEEKEDKEGCPSPSAQQALGKNFVMEGIESNSLAFFFFFNRYRYLRYCIIFLEYGTYQISIFHIVKVFSYLDSLFNQ